MNGLEQIRANYYSKYGKVVKAISRATVQIVIKT